MLLDNLVNRRSNGYRGGERGWGHGWTRDRGGVFHGRAVGMTRGGPLRVNTRPSPYKIAKSFSGARSMIGKPGLLEDSIAATGTSATETGTKLYVSNLDFGVSNEDIKELFSEVGDLRWSTVHYDRNGRPNGSAEVVFMRRSDALAALKRYNNVQLDGKAMKIEIIGDNLGLPVSARVNVVGGANGRGRRTVVMTPKLGQAGSQAYDRFSRKNPGGFQAARGRGRSSGRGSGPGRGRGRGRKQTTDKSADELDKELDNYHAEAMSS